MLNMFAGFLLAYSLLITLSGAGWYKKSKELETELEKLKRAK